MLSMTLRAVAVGGLSLGLAGVLGGCGAGGETTTAATITILPQSYQSKPAPTLVPESTTAPTAAEDGTTDQVQTYTVESGDYPSTVAEKFGITLDELLAFNDWELQGNIVPAFPGTGGTVRIPAGATFVDPNAPEETDDTEPDEVQTGDTTEDGSIIESPPTNIIDDATEDRCVPGKYTLQTGDYPGEVANKFDVSVEDLNAANRNTPNYNLFIVGSEIIIPAADDC